MSSTEKLPESLPTERGYTELLGVPMELVEQLRALHQAALDGEISRPTWEERHSQRLTEAGFGPESGSGPGSGPAVDPAELKRLEAQVDAVAGAITEDFDQFLFLGELATNLRLLQPPNPDQARRELEELLPTLTGGTPRATVERQLARLRSMTGRDESEVYEPATRMLKALQVGTLEEIYRWLRAATADGATVSVQDLLTQAAIEAAEAKLELDRYDELKDGPNKHPTP